VKDVVYTPYEQQRIEANSPRFIMGTPPQVKEQLERLAEKYRTDEIMIANIALSFEDRVRSYELLAELFL
jgi:alkanesulfonate monooxygenase SsuD/methylene tetrahydromethanopterin reductase-like flavin-dependent oxidoreductase (luciferase family)